MMGLIGNPKPWIPYMSIKDCSKGFCSLSCPQWCNLFFPPLSPPPLEFSGDNAGQNFSPFLLAVIGVLASVFLLVSYYAVISLYCRNQNSAERRENGDANRESAGNENDDGRWHCSPTGLDEALIKSIRVFKYKKEDGLIEGTDCSVCLSEFEEDDNLRLLPKCTHAFHVTCIDTWLKSHSNCPLCRGNVVTFVNSLPLPLPPATEAPRSNHESSLDGRYDNGGEGETESGGGVGEEETVQGNSEEGDTDTVIEVRCEEEQNIRRSVSMEEEREFEGGGGSSKRYVAQMSKSRRGNRGFHVKKSFSIGRCSFSRRGRGMIPV